MRLLARRAKNCAHILMAKAHRATSVSVGSQLALTIMVGEGGRHGNFVHVPSRQRPNQDEPPSDTRVRWQGIGPSAEPARRGGHHALGQAPFAFQAEHIGLCGATQAGVSHP